MKRFLELFLVLLLPTLAIGYIVTEHLGVWDSWLGLNEENRISRWTIAEWTAPNTPIPLVFKEHGASLLKDDVLLGRPRVSAAVEAKVLALRAKGGGMRSIARELG